jgi:post-segregation antitoxin (ccd killing protein)
MAKKKAEGLKLVSVRLPADLVKAARHYAVDVERDFQTVMADALRLLLAKKGGK